MNDDALLEISRMTREGYARAAEKIAARQRGELFERSAPWIRFVCEESARLLGLALFVAVIALWAAILSRLHAPTLL